MHQHVYGTHILHMIAMALVIIGALHWGLVAVGFNLVDTINRVLSKWIKMKLSLDKLIYALVALSGLYLAFQRSTWLPFLGEAVLPASLVPLKEKKGNTSIKVKVEPHTKIAYWAANPGNNPNIDVWTAYGTFENGGVVVSDEKGDAILTFDKGTEYNVPGGRHLKSHVHYRVLPSNSMMGPIQTIFVEDK